MPKMTYDVIEVNWHTTRITRFLVQSYEYEYAHRHKYMNVSPQDHFSKIVLNGQYKIGDVYEGQKSEAIRRYIS